MLGPVLDYWDDVVENQAVLYEELSNGLVWDERMRSRKTASFGLPYNYSGLSYDHVPFPERIEQIAAKVCCYTNMKANNCLANYYPDGESKMGFHSDATDHLLPGSGVAIVSLGARRTLTFCYVEDRAQQYPLALAGGSLLFVPLDVQQEWLHGLLPDEGGGGRISLTFRHIASGPSGG